MRSRMLVGVLVSAVMAVACASASATVYCVPAAFACGGIGKATLADAITATNVSSDADTIMLAVGTFTGAANLNHETHVVGAGQGKTIIESGTSGYGLNLQNPSSSVTDLTIHEPSGGPSIGLYLTGTAQRVTVDLRDNPLSGSTAVSLHGDAAFMDGAALASLSSPFADYGLTISEDGDPLVSNVKVQGRYAITTDGTGNKRLRFVQARGDIYGLNAGAESTLLEDSTVAGGPVVGYLFGGAADILTTLRHVTLDNSYVGAESDGHVSKVVVSNTAIVGGATDPESPDIELQRFSSGIARVEVDYSFFRAAHVIFTPGAGIEYVAGAHTIDGDTPKLLGLDRGDLRPSWDSPLVDTGDPVPGGGEPMADLAGGDRTVNGVTDIGAYEYGRHTPAITAAATPTAVLTGQGVLFKAFVTDDDQYELPAITWTFDDGTTASGDTVTHSFSTPGSHRATVTATDPTGLTATAFAPVTVTAPLLPRQVMAPAFGFKKLTARKGIVRVVLSCPVIAKNCAGIVKLKLAGTRKTGLGSARYRIAHGTKKTVKVRLTHGARKRLRRAGQGLRITVVAAPTGGKAKSKTVRLTGR